MYMQLFKWQHLCTLCCVEEFWNAYPILYIVYYISKSLSFRLWCSTKKEIMDNIIKNNPKKTRTLPLVHCFETPLSKIIYGISNANTYKFIAKYLCDTVVTQMVKAYWVRLKYNMLPTRGGFSIFVISQSIHYTTTQRKLSFHFNIF